MKKKKKANGTKRKFKPRTKKDIAHQGAGYGPPGEMMTLTETCIFFGGRSSPIDRSTFYRGVRNGLFPKPIKIGTKMSRWRLSDCQAALERMQSQGEQVA